MMMSPAGRREIKPFLFSENDWEKILEQSTIERDLTKHKIGLGKPRIIALPPIWQTQ